MENTPITKKFEIEIGGKNVVVETGKYAKQATSSVTVQCEDTMLFIQQMALDMKFHTIKMFCLIYTKQTAFKPMEIMAVAEDMGLTTIKTKQ